MKNIVIIGAGGFGKEIAWVIEDINKGSPKYHLLGYLDEKMLVGQKINRIPVIGTDDEIISLGRQMELYAVIGILDCEKKKGIVDTFSGFVQWETICHPTAVISDSAKIGCGTVVFPYATIGVDVVVGTHCFMNIHSMVGHDCVLGDYVSVLAGGKIGGNVSVGEGSMIATNATVLPGVKIGNNAVVGAGSVATKKVKDNVTVFGVPAQILVNGNR